jgi:hypothetical protein
MGLFPTNANRPVIFTYPLVNISFGHLLGHLIIYEIILNKANKALKNKNGIDGRGIQENFAKVEIR